MPDPKDKQKEKQKETPKKELSFSEMVEDVSEQFVPKVGKQAAPKGPTPLPPDDFLKKKDGISLTPPFTSTPTTADGPSPAIGDTNVSSDTPAPTTEPAPAPAVTPTPLAPKQQKDNPFRYLLVGTSAPFVNQFNDAKSLLERDIDLENNTRLSNFTDLQNEQNPNSLAAITTSRQGVAYGHMPTAKDKRTFDKAMVTADSEHLRTYTKKRHDALAQRENEIKDKQAAIVTKKSIVGGFKAIFQPDQYAEELAEYNELEKELETVRSYKKDFSDAVQHIAKVKVPEKLMANGTVPSNEEIGKEFLRVVNDPLVSEDVKALNSDLPITGIFDLINMDKGQRELDYTKERIRHKFDETGASIMSEYYNHIADRHFEVAQPKIERLAALTDLYNDADTDEGKRVLGSQINAIRSDESVQNFLTSTGKAVDYYQQAKASIDRFPQVKREKVREDINTAFFNLVNDPKLFESSDMKGLMRKFNPMNWIFGEEPKDSDIKELAEKTGYTVEQVKQAMKDQKEGFFGKAGAGVRVEGFLTGISKAVDETMGNMVAGARRITGGDDVDIRNRILADKLADYTKNGAGNDLIDDTGKYNINPYSIASTLGRGTGQLSAYAAPTLITGGVAGAVLEGAGIAATTAGRTVKGVETLTTLANPGAYEDAWVEGARAGLSEEERHGYATLTALANNAVELFYSPADMVRGAGNIFRGKVRANMLKEFATVASKDGVSAAVINGMKNLGKFAKEAGDVVLAENLEEFATNKMTNVLDERYLGKTLSPEQIAKQNADTFITTTLQTLLTGVGAGVHGVNDASNVRKQSLFEAGHESDKYKEEMQKLFASGKLNQQQLNEKIATINTMQDIVKQLPAKNAKGQELTYDEKVMLAAQQYRIRSNNRIAEGSSVDAEKDQISADNDKAKKIQEGILTGQYYRIKGEAVTRDEMSQAIEKGSEYLLEIGGDPELQKRLNEVGHGVFNGLDENHKDFKAIAKDMKKAYGVHHVGTDHKGNPHLFFRHEKTLSGLIGKNPNNVVERLMAVAKEGDSVSFYDANEDVVVSGIVDADGNISNLEGPITKPSEIKGVANGIVTIFRNNLPQHMTGGFVDVGAAVAKAAEGEALSPEEQTAIEDNPEEALDEAKKLVQDSLDENEDPEQAAKDLIAQALAATSTNETTEETKEAATTEAAPAATGTAPAAATTNTVDQEAGTGTQTNAEDAVDKVTSFKTSKGSVYAVHDDGTTTRNKSYHAEHGGDEGLKSRSQQTVYVNANQVNKLSLMQTQGWENGDHPYLIVDKKEGKVAVGVNRNGERTYDAQSVIDYSTRPEVGKTPVEIWSDGRNVHFGNEITEISSSPQNTSDETQSESADSSTGTSTGNSPSQEQKQNNEENEQGNRNEQGQKSVKTGSTSTNESTGTNTAEPISVAGYTFSNDPDFKRPFEGGGLIFKERADLKGWIDRNYDNLKKTDLGNGWVRIESDIQNQEKVGTVYYSPVSEEVVVIDHKTPSLVDKAVKDFIAHNPRSKKRAANNSIKEGDQYQIDQRGKSMVITVTGEPHVGIVPIEFPSGRKGFVKVEKLTNKISASKTTDNAIQDKEVTLSDAEQDTNKNQLSEGAQEKPGINRESEANDASAATKRRTEAANAWLDSVTGSDRAESQNKAKELLRQSNYKKDKEREGILSSVDSRGAQVRTSGDNGKEVGQEVASNGTRSPQGQQWPEQRGGQSNTKNEGGAQQPSRKGEATGTLSNDGRLNEAERRSVVEALRALSDMHDDRLQARSQRYLRELLSQSSKDEEKTNEIIDLITQNINTDGTLSFKSSTTIHVRNESGLSEQVRAGNEEAIQTPTGESEEEKSPEEEVGEALNVEQPTQGTESTDVEKAKDEVRELRAKFKASVRRSMGNTNMNGGDLEFIVDGMNMLAGYAKLGWYKLTDIVREILADGDIDFVKDKKVMDGLRTAYGANLVNATREDRLKYDNIDHIDDFFENELPGILEAAEAINTDESGASFAPLDEKFEKAVEPHIAFKDSVKKNIVEGQKQNIVNLRAVGRGLGMEASDIELQELAELAVVELSREAALSNKSFDQKLVDISTIYDNQPSLNQRSSTRVELQQYSTPAPITFVAGDYINAIAPQRIFEPSAGNGLLTIAFPANIVSVNEIDATRLRSLATQNFKSVSNQDATLPFTALSRTQDGVLTNPPFGAAENKVFDGYNIRGLAPQMAINALETMKDDGRAAIIIGGHNSYGEDGRLQKDRFFFNYLYSHYNVADVIDINGDLYRKQGTSFDIRLILIDGRKAVAGGLAPTRDQHNTKRVDSFRELADRVKSLPAFEKNNNETVSKPQLDAGGNNGNLIPGTNQQSRPDQGTGARTTSGTNSRNSPQQSGTRGDSGQDDNGNVGGQSSASESDTDANSSLPPTDGRVQNNDQQVPNGTDATGTLDDGTSGTDIQRSKPLQPARQFTSSELAKEKIPYEPVSTSEPVGTVIPTQMASEAQRVLRKIDEEEGGVDNYVKNRLQYPSIEAVKKAFSAEQVDAIAMAVAQIEQNNGMIIGDMTGVGKGRIAAGIIRYGVLNGFKPLFLTEKTTLFSDIYRDLIDIDSAGFVPFILNNPDPDRDPNIYDKEGTLVFKAGTAKAKDVWFRSLELPQDAQYMVASYSQFNTNPSKPSAKREFLRSLAQGNIFVMDESHNAGGDGNTGTLFQEVLESVKGAIYLSATFAKTPKNMPVYSVKTAMREANMSKEELVQAIESGGVALQEVVSSQLVESGQMLRRERSFDGVSIDYEMLHHLKDQHRVTADLVTDIIRNVITFQKYYVGPVIDQMDDAAKADGDDIATTQGTSMAGVSNPPFASRVFNVIDQFLFSIKAEEAANAAIEELKAGRKPVIKFKSTMESFLKNEDFQIGDELAKPDFSLALKRALDTVMRYTVTDAGGNSTTMQIDPSALTKEGQEAYYYIRNKVDEVSTGISISPIDLMIKKIQDAGYTVAEITGRKMVLQYRDDGSAVVVEREDRDTRTNVAKFNAGELDVIMFNASGATGISMHASATFKDQRQRVMIIPQLELDINKEIQGRGRTDRTGQVMRSAYRYIVSSIPAELRLLMMFQAKVKSLDANTTSSQKSKASKVSITDDFLNKYGDEIIWEYLKEHPETNEKLLDPLSMFNKSEDELSALSAPEDAARKVTGRVAILSSEDQEKFYSEVADRYKELMEYKESINENDLEVKVMPLEAKTLSRTVAIVGKGGVSPFGADSILEKVEANISRKPYTKEELQKLISDSLDGRTAGEISTGMVKDMQSYMDNKIEEERANIEKYIAEKVEEAHKTIKGKTEDERQEKVKAKLEILETARVAKINVMENKMEGLRSMAIRRFTFFTVGRPLMIPTNSNVAAGVVSQSKGVFLGFEIKEKAKNRYAPSNIKLRFAVEDSRRYIAVPSSQGGFIDATIAGSFMNFSGMNTMIENWGQGKSSADRGIQYIITGNVLQAYGKMKGQLVSFSTDKGELRKGILLNEVEVARLGDAGVRVPINKALGFVQDQLASDYRVQSIDGEVTLGTDRRDRLTIEVPRSKKNGSKYYLNEKLRRLVDHNEFNTVGGGMMATYHPSDLLSILDVLTNEFGTNLELTREQAGVKEEKVDDDEASLQSAADHVRDNLPGTLDEAPVQSDESVSVVLNRLSTGNGPVAEIAKQINPDQGSLNVRFQVRETPDGRSYYDPISDTIVLTPEHAKDDIIVLHEITHATTAKKIPAGLNTVEKIIAYINDPASDPDVVLLAKVFIQALQKTRPGAYGLTNLDEFVSEVFSNKNFRKELAAAKYRETKQSLWQKFVTAIKGLLGVKSETLLNKAMQAGFRIMENAKRGEARAGQIKSSDALQKALQNLAFIRLQNTVPFADYIAEVMKDFNYGGTPEQKRVIRLAYEAARNMHAKLNEATTPEQRQAVIDAEDFEPLKKNIRKRVETMFPPSGEATTSSVKNLTAAMNRDRLGVLGEIPKTVRSDEEVRAEADKLEKDYNIRGLINTLLDKVRTATDVELELLGRYIAGKEAEVDRLNTEMLSTVDENGDIGDVRDRRDIALNELNEAYNAARFTGTETARALRYRRHMRFQDESLAEMFAAESKSAGSSTFTDAQKDQVMKEFSEIKAAKEAYEARITILEDQLAQEEAAAAANKAKRTGKKSAERKDKKTHEDFAKERQSIVAQMKQDLKDLRRGKKGLMALPIPYAAQLITIAPSVARLTASLIDEGITSLVDIVSNIKNLVQDEIPEITDRDVHDLIAGVYNDNQKPKSVLQQQLFELRREARLTTELEDLMNGLPPKDPKKAVKANAKIEALQKQIKDFKKKYREANEDPLPKMKAGIKKRIAELEAKLAAGDYAPEPRAIKITLDDEAKALQNNLIDLRRERTKRLAQQEYDRRSGRYKAKRVLEEVAGIPRTAMSSFDFSAMLRQGIVATISHPILAVNAAVEMFRQTVSQKRFDRWLDDLKRSSDFNEMQEAGLFIADPDAFELSQHEEVFRAKMIEKIPVYGTVFIKGSERAFVSYLNKLRVDVYRQGAGTLLAEGRTFENDPKTYKALAGFVNNATGRGELLWEKSAGFLSIVLFSPRLIASRLTLLNPLYYARLPRPVAKMALADMATFVGFGLSVLALAKFWLPCSVSSEATSADFGKIKCGDTRYDIWGGFQPYIRVFSQFFAGKRTNSSTSEEQEVNRGDVAARFFRGKLAPVPAAIVDFAQGRRITGEEVTVSGKAAELFSPLIIQDIHKAWQEEGAVSLITTGLPTAFGIGVQTYNK